jgi:energy-coupling factor transport system ATP-binding protein
VQDIAIEVINENFIYSGTNKRILKNINLKISKGEFITIIGPNGAGKTTLVRTFIGLNKPTEGRVLVDGEDITNLTVAETSRKVGFLFQNPDHQLFEDDVYKEIEVGLLNRKLPKDEIDEKIKQCLEICGLDKLKERAPENLSVGEKKLVALASIIALGTDIYIFDEPTTGQTWKSLNKLFSIIDELHKKGKTVLMITHDVRLIERYSHRVIAVIGGEIVYDGEGQDLFQNDELMKKVHLTKPAILDISQRLSEEYNIKPCMDVSKLVKQIQDKIKCPI